MMDPRALQRVEQMHARVRTLDLPGAAERELVSTVLAHQAVWDLLVKAGPRPGRAPRMLEAGGRRWVVVNFPVCEDSFSDHGWADRTSPVKLRPGDPPGTIHRCTPLCRAYRCWQRARVARRRRR